MTLYKVVLCTLTLSLVLVSCAEYVKIKSLDINFTDSTAITDVELHQERRFNKSYTLDSKWFSNLKASSEKNGVVLNYDIKSDSEVVFIKLVFTDPKKIRSFLHGIDLPRHFSRRVDHERQFRLFIDYYQNEDSAYFSMNFASDVFCPLDNYISIETPSAATNFYPAVLTDSLQPERVSPNKSYFYTNTFGTRWQKISCYYKKNKRIIPVIPDSSYYIAKSEKNTNSKEEIKKEESKEITLFGFSQNSWQFWCTIIGGIAAIFTIVEFFRRR